MSVRERSRQRVSAGAGSSSSDEAAVLTTDCEDTSSAADHSYLVGADGVGLKGDYGNVALLLLLYMLQGVPLGLGAAVPLLLQNRGASYSEQAGFSLAYWPFSLKLLWAPIVDALYIRRCGRRKTWLVPVQYAIGVFLLVLAGHSDWLLGNGDVSGVDGVNSATTTPTALDNSSLPSLAPNSTHETQSQSQQDRPNVPLLTVVFFALNFLAATQDIAVDGWALTILHRRNVGHASTCNSVGQSGGYFLGFVVFVALESADFCNNYLRSHPQPTGLVTFSGYMIFWAVMFMITTTLVMLFKRETCRSTEQHKSHTTSSAVNTDSSDTAGIRQTYRQLWCITRLPPVRSLIAVLLTAKVGFAAADAVTGLKLLEAGVPRQQLALLAVPMTPLQLLLPLIISRHTTGPRPMSLFLAAMPWRLLIGVFMAVFVYYTPTFRVAAAAGSDASAIYPSSYYLLLLVLLCLHQVALYSMFVAVMAFFARISDPSVGGTYMTLLNTVANLGGNWPTVVVLWLMDRLTWSHCSNNTSLSCHSKSLKQSCEAGGGSCIIDLDGYYVESACCCVLGILWLFLGGRRRLQQLQLLDVSAWRCRLPRD